MGNLAVISGMHSRTCLLGVAEDPRADQPSDITVALKPHQLTSLAKMMAIEAGSIEYDLLSAGRFEVTSKIGILADLPGYGKTLTALALVAADEGIHAKAQQVHLWTSCSYKETPTLTIWQRPALAEAHQISQGASSCDIDQRAEASVALVKSGVVFKQWLETIEFRTNLKVAAIASKKDLTNWLSTRGEGLPILPPREERMDIVLVSDSVYQHFAAATLRIRWKRVLIDEPDDVYTVNMPDIKAESFWLITATPQRLRTPRNRGLIPNLCRKEFFHGTPRRRNFEFITVQNTESYVKQSFQVPDCELQNYLCKFPYNVRHGLPRRVRDRLNANDLEGALRSLDGQTGDDLGQLVMNRLTTEIGNLDIQIEALERLDIRERDRNHRLEPLLAARQTAQTSLQNVEDRLERLADAECPICLDEVDTPVCLPCLHSFCGACLMRHLRSRMNYRFEETAPCPMCRKPIELANIIRVTKESENKRPLVLKQDVVIDILRKHAEGRAIIFCNFDATFHQLSTILKDRSIAHEFLTGRPGMEETVARFRRGDIRVLMLNSRENGSGIDLSCATDIIFYMALANANEDRQALGRAQRVGRTTTLRVHRLFHDNELPTELKDDPSRLIVPQDPNELSAASEEWILGAVDR